MDGAHFNIQATAFRMGCSVLLGWVGWEHGQEKWESEIRTPKWAKDDVDGKVHMRCHRKEQIHTPKGTSTSTGRYTRTVEWSNNLKRNHYPLAGMLHEWRILNIVHSNTAKSCIVCRVLKWTKWTKKNFKKLLKKEVNTARVCAQIIVIHFAALLIVCKCASWFAWWLL